MEYNPVMVNIPASIACIFNFVLSIPVTMPASIPPSTPIIIPISGFLATAHTALYASPVTKLPSTVRSGKSKILKVMNSPNDNIANISPNSILPSNVDNVIFSPTYLI